MRLYARNPHLLDTLLRCAAHSTRLIATRMCCNARSFHDSFNDVLWEGACLETKGTFGRSSTGSGRTQSMVRASHSTTAIQTQTSVKRC